MVNNDILWSGGKHKFQVGAKRRKPGPNEWSFAWKLQAARKLQVCSRIPVANETPRATELHTCSGIPGGRKSQAAGESLRVGKCMSGRGLRSRLKCRDGSEFQGLEITDWGEFTVSRRNHESVQNDEKFLVPAGQSEYDAFQLLEHPGRRWVDSGKT